MAMNYEELRDKLLKVKYATGVSVYYNKKYERYTVKLHRNRRWTIEANGKTFDECYTKILMRLQKERGCGE